MVNAGECHKDGQMHIYDSIITVTLIEKIVVMMKIKSQGKYSVIGVIISAVALIMAIVVMESNYLISIMSPTILRWLMAGCIVCCILSMIGFAMCVVGLVVKKLRGLAIAGICLSVLTLTGIPFESYRIMETCFITAKISIQEDVPIPHVKKIEPIVRIVLNADDYFDCISLESEELTTRFSLNDEDVVRNLHNWLSSVSDKETFAGGGAIAIKCDSGVTFFSVHRLYDSLSVAGYNRFTVETRCLDEKDDEEDENDF